MSRKEKLEAFPTGHPNQFEVRNNFNDLAGDWDESYVTFSGYFGKHGPHVFAAAPDLLEALEALTTNPYVNLGDLIYQVRDREGLGWEGPNVTAWNNAFMAANAAIAKAKGGA